MVEAVEVFEVVEDLVDDVVAVVVALDVDSEDVAVVEYAQSWGASEGSEAE